MTRMPKKRTNVRLSHLAEERNRIRQSRRLDLQTGGAHWGYIATSIETIEKLLQTPIREDLRRRVSQQNRVLHVLDLGGGHGRALSEIKREFGQRIHTTNFTTAQKKEIPQRGIDLLTATISGKTHQGKYDYIFSSFGSVHHSSLTAAWVNRIVRLLAPGGKAVVMLPYHYVSPTRTEIEFINQLTKTAQVSAKHYPGQIGTMGHKPVLILEKKS